MDDRITKAVTIYINKILFIERVFMCLITFQWQPRNERKLILSANRDEFTQRPALPLHAWKDHDGVFAGKDIQQGGSWLGIHKNGRFAALTNHRNFLIKDPKNPISRGNLVLDFLTSSVSPIDYLQQLESTANDYAGYNLIVADSNSMAYFSNRSGLPAKNLEPGLYGLSNGLLNTPWPKLCSATSKLTHWLNTPTDPQSPMTELAGLLSSTEYAADADLPETGVTLEQERILSSEKIITPYYGTRCSTGLIWEGDKITIEEVSWETDGSEKERRRYNTYKASEEG